MAFYMLGRYAAMNIFQKSLFYHLDKRGVPVVPWVLNSENEYNAATKLQIHGLITDCPSKLRKFLENDENKVKND